MRHAYGGTSIFVTTRRYSSGGVASKNERKSGGELNDPGLPSKEGKEAAAA